MNQKLLKISISVHGVAIALVVLNMLLKYFTIYSLESRIKFGIEVFALFSGFLLFLYFLAVKKRVHLYFALHGALSLLTLIGLVFSRAILFLVIFFVFRPFIPNTDHFEENGIIISVPFQGFMAPCCTYEINERKWLVFEKEIEIWKPIEERSITFDEIQVSSNEIEIYYSINDDHVINKRAIKK